MSLQAADFVRQQLWDGSTKRLRRSFCRNPSAVQGFADDYAFLISEPYSCCMISHACAAACALSVSKQLTSDCVLNLAKVWHF